MGSASALLASNIADQRGMTPKPLFPEFRQMFGHALVEGAGQVGDELAAFAPARAPDIGGPPS